VVAVLGAPRLDDLETAPFFPDWKMEAVNAVTGLDLFQQAGRIVSERRGGVEAPIDGFEEAS
jgi:hypothetical protein